MVYVTDVFVFICLTALHVYSYIQHLIVNTGFRSKTAIHPEVYRFSAIKNQKNTNNSGWKFREKKLNYIIYLKFERNEDFFSFDKFQVSTRISLIFGLSKIRQLN